MPCGTGIRIQYNRIMSENIVFSNVNRKEQLQKAAQMSYDLVVVGGGITGAGIALDASSRGMKVLLLEKVLLEVQVVIQVTTEKQVVMVQVLVLIQVEVVLQLYYLQMFQFQDIQLLKHQTLC